MKVPYQPEQLSAVAEQFGTPTYAYFEQIIRDRCQQLKHRIADLPSKLLYAMKANYNPAVLQIVKEEGLGLDVVSIGELELAKQLGFAPEDILFSANSITDSEMHEAKQYGVLFNIGELSRLESFGKSYPNEKVCVRLNPDIGSGHHEYVITAGKKSKFGIPMSQVSDIIATAEKYGLKIVGIHQHIGSNIVTIEDLWASIQVLLNVVSHFKDVEFINVGGGLGIPYHAGADCFDFNGFRQELIPNLIEWSSHQTNPVAFWFEPGRFVVAEAGVLLTEATYVKFNGERTFAGTNTGFNHLIRPMCYDAHHEIYNLSNPDGGLHTYDVVGNICETGDRFAKNRPIQKIREHDIIAILDAGAYGLAMASLYNLRALPAEVLIKADGTPKLIRKRLNNQSLVAQLIAETVHLED